RRPRPVADAGMAAARWPGDGLPRRGGRSRLTRQLLPHRRLPRHGRIDRLVLPLQRGRLGGPSRVPGLGRAARCHGHGRHGARRRRRRLYDPPRARAHARGPRQRSGAAAAGAAHAGGAAVNRPFAPQVVTAPPRPSLAVLVAVSALQPFALNVLAPATPALARAFATDYATIQLTLGLYLLAVAVTQVVIGPISDRFGRRPCVLGGVALFT